MPIVGTAGHVDHGKSTLIRSLTGRDPDRWAEEKERGLTIDLGFAWTTLEPCGQVGFVDVPGHERFVKNMLAGVGAIDAVLFVVAADEGWMPQSEEHLAILDLLDIRHGVVALTRRDLVDDELAELAQLETSERLGGTTLEGLEIVPVSATTGEGMSRLREVLAEALTTAGPSLDTGNPRLWVDRSFVISGAGVVVTGTLAGGSVDTGSELLLYPGGRKVRVRSIQSHEEATTRVGPGTRVAFNLAGLDRDEIERGGLVTNDPVRESQRFTAFMRAVRGLDASPTDRGAYRLHLGSGSWSVRLRLLDAAALTREPTTVLVTADGPIPLRMGDRFVIRDVGRRAVVAGGRVLDPDPPRRGVDIRASSPDLVAALDADRDTRANALLKGRGFARIDDLRADTDGGIPDSSNRIADHAISTERLRSLADTAQRMVAGFHAENPLRDGMPKASMSSALNVPPAIVEHIVAAAGLVDDGATVRTDSFAIGLTDGQKEMWLETVAILRAAGNAAPRAASLPLDTELLHAKLRGGDLIRIDQDLVYLPESLAEIEAGMRTLPDPFTVSEFREHLGMSRRQAVPLLEWFDSRGVTTRDGDVRRLT